MTDLDERVVELLRDAVPQPPNELDPQRIRSRAPAGTRRTFRYAPALAAAVVLAVAIGGYFVVQHQQPKPARESQPPSQQLPQQSRTPRAATQRAVQRLFDAVPVQPGATRVHRSPVTALDKPLEQPGSSNLVTRTGWWTTPATESEVLAYVSAHLPAGIGRSGSISAGGRAGETNRGLTFGPTGSRWTRPAVYTGLELIVAVAPLPSNAGTGVRIDTDAIWLPQRTAGQRVPLTVTSVDVVVDRNGYAQTVRRTLPAGDARALASLVNGLHVETPGIFSCPMMRGFVDTLTFHTAQGSVTVRADADGCTPVTIEGSARRGPTLSGGALVDRAVLHLLDLPRNYGG